MRRTVARATMLGACTIAWGALGPAWRGTAWAQAPAQERGPLEGGVLVKGWSGRPDPQAEQQGRRIGDARFWSVGDTLVATSGPAAAYWNPAHVARGAYLVRATFALSPAVPPERETVGLFIGGSGLDGDRRNYLYCALHGAGTYSVKHRYGSELHTLVERKPSAAIRRPDASGRSTNEIAWRVDASQVTCLVNGEAVASFPRAGVIGEGKLEATDGIYGLRVSHNLEVRVTGFMRAP